MLQAIDYKTGQIKWSHKWPGNGGGVRSGLLSTASGLLFAGRSEFELRGARRSHGESTMACGTAHECDQRPDHI